MENSMVLHPLILSRRNVSAEPHTRLHFVTLTLVVRPDNDSSAPAGFFERRQRTFKCQLRLNLLIGILFNFIASCCNSSKSVSETESEGA